MKYFSKFVRDFEYEGLREKVTYIDLIAQLAELFVAPQLIIFFDILCLSIHFPEISNITCRNNTKKIKLDSNLEPTSWASGHQRPGLVSNSLS